MPYLQRKVLLADESRTFRNLFATSLAAADCEILTCSSGREALDLVGGRYIDFICSSFYLPDMEGIQLCQQVRLITKQAYKPFVLLTSVEAQDSLRRALPAGVTDIFHKNDVEQLLAFIRRFPFTGRRIEGRILYVEDSPSQRELLKAMLERHGLTVDAFASADEAWPHFLAKAYDVVLTDIVLDGTMSGLAFVNRIRRQTDDKGDTPVLAITAFDDRTRRIELFNLGVTDYIIKPAADEELCARISALIALRRRNAQLENERQRLRLETLVAERTHALEATNRELQSFSYSVSHDLRAPLRAISGYCRIVASDEEEKLSAEGRHMLERAVQNANHMAELIDDILDYSRSGSQPLECRPVDLAAVASEVAHALGADYPQARIGIGPLPVVEGDPTMLQQIMQNLVANACKFSAHRTPPQIEVDCTDMDGERVFRVRDNGVGFDMRYADKLFGLFQRLHTQSEFPGTGVGLAIVKRLIARHGGRIWAESAPDRGTTFFFTLGADAGS